MKTKTNSISIEALDTLFFRNGKPFERGEDANGAGLFPPAPSVYHGALRTAYFAQHGTGFISSQKVAAATRGLSIQSVALQTYDDRLLFPTPSDLVIPKEDEGKRSSEATLLSVSAAPTISNYPPTLSVLVSQVDYPVVGSLAYRIDQKQLEAYLNNTEGTFEVERLQHYLTGESKVGIGRDLKTGAVLEGHLYFVNFVRPRNDQGEGLRIHLTYQTRWEKPLHESGYLRLGGEGKIAHYHRDVLQRAIIQQPEIQSKYLKIYLATPCYFRNGWLPEGIDHKTFQGKLHGIEVQLVTAAIGRPEHLGGFDQQRQIPKPMRRLVPAGSVYYLKTETLTDAAALSAKIHGTSITEEDSLHEQNVESDYYRRRGFGIAYVGNWKMNDNE